MTNSRSRSRSNSKTYKRKAPSTLFIETPEKELTPKATEIFKNINKSLEKNGIQLNFDNDNNNNRGNLTSITFDKKTLERMNKNPFGRKYTRIGGKYKQNKTKNHKIKNKTKKNNNKSQKNK